MLPKPFKSEGRPSKCRGQRRPMNRADMCSDNVYIETESPLKPLGGEVVILLTIIITSLDD